MFRPSITWILYAMHSVGAKRFDLRSLSPALRNLWLLLASINFMFLVFLFLLFLNSACQPGWIGSGTSCYKFVTSPKLTWDKAKEECKNWQAGLVKVESPEETEFIKKKRFADLWKGYLLDWTFWLCQWRWLDVDGRNSIGFARIHKLGKWTAGQFR